MCVVHITPRIVIFWRRNQTGLFYICFKAHKGEGPQLWLYSVVEGLSPDLSRIHLPLSKAGFVVP